MGPWYKAMPMADWPNFVLSLIKPCDLHAGSHVVECSAPGRKNTEAISVPLNKSSKLHYWQGLPVNSYGVLWNHYASIFSQEMV